MDFTFEDWKQTVLSHHPTAQFTEETGAGETYGEIGEWVAHIGPDMQADVVGVFTTEGYCSVLENGEYIDYENYLYD